MNPPGCREGGDNVQIKLMGVLERKEATEAEEAEKIDAAELSAVVDLARDVRVVDAGKGRYACTYSIDANSAGQTALLEVIVNGKHVLHSPFRVPIRIVEAVLEFKEVPVDPHESTLHGPPGVLHYLATEGGTRAFSNPHDSGLVVASMSSLGERCDPCSSCLYECYADPSRLVQGHSHDGKVNYTRNQPGSWVAVDLKRHLIPSHYCLRSGFMGEGYSMHTWLLEGSIDGRSWTLLREHRNDKSFAGTRRNKSGTLLYNVASWPIDTDTVFRHFRIRLQHCRCTSWLGCAGIELWGKLLKEDGPTSRA